MYAPGHESAAGNAAALRSPQSPPQFPIPELTECPNSALDQETLLCLYAHTGQFLLKYLIALLVITEPIFHLQIAYLR